MASITFQALGNVKNIRKNDSGKVLSFSLSEYAGKDENGKGKYNSIMCKVLGEKSVQHFEKFFGEGSAIYVTGNIQSNNYEKDGTMVYGTDYVVGQMNFIPKDFRDHTALTEAPAESAITEDSLPF